MTDEIKNKIGRPTDYGPGILELTRDYLSNYPNFGDAIPSIAGLSTFLKIARSTIYEWAKHEDKKEFSDILEDILSDQERTLINKGLKGEFNSTITKLALGKHGYKDNADVTSGGEKLNVVWGNAENKNNTDSVQS
jgi:hypothetical protein